MRSERIELNDSTMDVVMKMSDGNPGAMQVIMQMLQPNDIDPDNGLGGLGPILLLDTYGIYGTDIYILHSDICDRDLVKTLAVLRATQLGIFSERTLKDACHRQDRSGKDMVPVEELYLKVKQRLRNFDAHTKEKVSQ
jgi:hypothetical protein